MLDFLKDPNDPSKKIDFMVVLQQHGFTHAKWLEMESYWTPRVASDQDPKFNPQQAQRFRELMQMERQERENLARIFEWPETV